MDMKTPAKRTFDALPDTIDFRDTLYISSLVAVRAISDIESFRSHKIPILDQGKEGACTGYGLATVANYLIKARGGTETADSVSAWMLYAMAKRYDEWPGEEYDGSSARGAMKGWHKHGLCAERLWKDKKGDVTLTETRAADALERPLGAYFRVNHKDLVAMHAAISETGVLFATATVHTGWQRVQEGDEAIVFEEGVIGGHAFAVVGYNREGFWIQNSWGPRWGRGGIALLTYADWLSNGTDVWVAALGAPVAVGRPVGSSEMMVGAPRSYESQVYASLRPYIIACKNDGLLDDKGSYGLTPSALRSLITEQMPKRMDGWAKKKVVIYAHGGLVSQDAAIQTVANNREPLLKAEVYPLSLIWRSDAWTTLGNILREAVRGRRDEDFLDRAKDFMLDRLDDTLEPLARLLGGKALWDEMKENAEGATKNKKGGARLMADHLIELYKDGGIDEIHLVGHSAGSILHGLLAQHLVDGGVKIRSLSLWAPACTMDLFDTVFKPLIEAGKIESFDLYTLDDATEQNDHCANIYHKSLLYLVSAAFEARPRIPGVRDGVPILGMAKFAQTIPKSFWRPQACNWFLSPSEKSRSVHHGDFDNDGTTLQSTLSRILRQDITLDLTGATQSMLAKSGLAQQRRRAKLNVALVR
ncbi:peptidase C1 [Methylobacterium sp. Leaf123]|uniref:C1 family peptidase n=1 Tax=Methylobacterium sp. Leaf123 TaxID=1736264 RepID=UPI0006FF7A4A|nr:C1 family peptidase [Methylobacterium sp. Leaf123]KQQ31171.1 peptidase C1 [Methylobacterium sp. Leaf123]